ncbi:MAG: DUF554 domain-containing protein [Fretibacterium sp.]|nr:DUF554 domain-containing protein [Fretibacterium sp.]
MEFLRHIPMGGTLFNAAAIVAGGLCGLLIGRFIPERVHRAIFQCFGLFCFYLGIDMALRTKGLLVCLMSLTVGVIIGELLDLDSRLASVGDFLKAKTGRGRHETFTEGFVSSTLLYCIGSMAILGSIENGINNNPDILVAKGVMDGTSSILLAASLGVGVLFSSLPLMLYQGVITLAAGQAQIFITPTMMDNLSGVGGIMILAIGFNLLKIVEIKTCNYLPAVLLVVLLSALF